MNGKDVNECLNCDCYDEDFGCTMPSIDKWYACPLEADEEELRAMFARDEAEWQYEHGSWGCSECGRAPSAKGDYWDFEDDRPTFGFCPHCGAKMGGEAK